MFHRTRKGMMFRRDGVFGMIDWFFEKVFPIMFVLIFVTILGMMIFVIVMTVIQDGNLCDTPFGARDLRCVGYYSRHRY